MCCLFGMLDYKNRFNAKQKNKIISILSVACEARGTDATGIAYNHNGHLSVYKRPLAAHKMRFNIPDVDLIMGHTRMTTQGNENTISITTHFTARLVIPNLPWLTMEYCITI